jgi:hypothetical protein
MQVSLSCASRTGIDGLGDAALAEPGRNVRPKPSGTTAPLSVASLADGLSVVDTLVLEEPFRSVASPAARPPPKSSPSAVPPAPKPLLPGLELVLNVRSHTSVDLAASVPVKAAAPPFRPPFRVAPVRSSSRVPPAAKTAAVKRSTSAPTRSSRPKSCSSSGSERSARRSGTSRRSSRSDSPVNYAVVPIIQRLARERPRELCFIAEEHHQPRAGSSLPFSLASHLQL